MNDQRIRICERCEYSKKISRGKNKGKPSHPLDCGLKMPDFWAALNNAAMTGNHNFKSPCTVRWKTFTLPNNCPYKLEHLMENRDGVVTNGSSG